MCTAPANDHHRSINGLYDGMLSTLLHIKHKFLLQFEGGGGGRVCVQEISTRPYHPETITNLLVKKKNYELFKKGAKKLHLTKFTCFVAIYDFASDLHGSRTNSTFLRN